jgi:hypothetical protein
LLCRGEKTAHRFGGLFHQVHQDLTHPGDEKG